MTTRTLRLREYVTTPAVSLSPDERDALRRTVPSLRVVPTVGRERHYDLTPASDIGAVSLGSLAITIRPKLDIDRVLFLVSYAVNPRHWLDTSVAFTAAPTLLEALVPGFVVQVRRALAPGPLQGYRAEEDALPTIRGRLRFADQIRDRYGRFPPAEVAFDEFTEDIEINRLLKAALHRLRLLRLRSDWVRRSLRVFDAILGGVALAEYDDRSLPEVVYNRLNDRYRPAVELSKLILRATSIELEHGEVRSSAFLLDMNRVFEDFVVVALREALALSSTSFPQGARSRSLFLDRGERIRLAPDLSWWDGRRCTFVGDAKYKRVNVPGVKHPDLYQLLSYVIATGLPGGLLIYAAGEEDPVSHDVAHIGRELHVMTIDLAGEPDKILSRIAVIAQQVRTLRSRAVDRRVAASR